MKQDEFEVLEAWKREQPSSLTWVRHLRFSSAVGILFEYLASCPYCAGIRKTERENTKSPNTFSGKLYLKLYIVENNSVIVSMDYF
jgi:hypothetical protein